MSKLIDYLFNRGKSGRCIHCGRKLTEIEVEYYEISCERCERKLLKRLSKTEL